MRTKVLVVEDEVLVAEDIRQVLWGFGYEVLAVVDTAAEALAVAAKRRPDVALLDIGLHGHEDGVEVALRLREACGVAIVFLTSHADDDTLERAKRARPGAFLIKPFVERELRTAIELALGARAHQAEQNRRERWLRAILAAIPEAILVTDPAGAVTFLNPMAEELAGCTSAEALGRPQSGIRPRASVHETATRVLGEDGEDLGRVLLWRRRS